ncbi:MAG: hypothetical protein QG608_1385, partial [Actinomycetota bacterium]|nr:hypothetical protein [Actinomycetota bacterium]
AIARTSPKVKKSRNNGSGIAFRSAWCQLFDASGFTGLRRIVTCHLEDGTQIKGVLNSWNPSVDDSPDRDLTLSPPILIKNDDTQHLIQYGAVAIPARRMNWIHVDYMRDDEYETEIQSQINPLTPPSLASP